MFPLLTALHGAAAAHGELRQVAELRLPHLLGRAARPPARAPAWRAHRGAALRRIRAAAPARKIPGTNK